MVELRLQGGPINEVVRIGQTVRRPAPRASFVHVLLDHLERHDWPGAPRFIGIDKQGREILTYLDGQAAWRPGHARRVRSDYCLTHLAQLLRHLHDLTAGTQFSAEHEVTCHNDLSPKNTLYHDLDSSAPRPVAFIGWDLAGPGQRIHGIAHACWQYLDLGPAITDIDEAARKIRLICDAYGLRHRDHLVQTILWWQNRCWRGIQAAAASGDAAMIRLRDNCAAHTVRAAHEWMASHQDDFHTRVA